MLLSKLLDEVKPIKFVGNTQVEIKELTQDSRTVEPGTGFIAIKGYTVDGHDYIDRAIENGAGVIFLNHGFEYVPNDKITYVEYQDTDLILPDLSAVFYDHPTDDMTMIGVTGTNGKTSITLMLEAMLKNQSLMTAMVGTIENHIGDVVYETQNTTPNALELNRFFRRAKETGVRYTVMEVSSHALKLNRVKHIHYDYAIFTNLTEDHLDFHPDFEDYFYSKALLFKRAQKGVIINLEDSYGRRLVEENLFEAPLWTYGLASHAKVYAENIDYKASGTTATLVTPLGKLDIHIKIPGDIYVLNTLACITTLLALGYDLEVIKSCVEVIKPVRGRLETVDNPKGDAIIVDYAHTPDALDNVLKVTRGFTEGRLIAVFGCGGDRDRKKRPLMGGIGYQRADIIIVTSDNPRTEAPETILDDIFEGIPKDNLKDHKKVYREVDRRKAIQLALQLVKPGDTVVISGKGHETYQIIGRTKHHFDDAEEVRNYYKK